MECWLLNSEAPAAEVLSNENIISKAKDMAALSEAIISKDVMVEEDCREISISSRGSRAEIGAASAVHPAPCCS